MATTYAMPGIAPATFDHRTARSHPSSDLTSNATTSDRTPHSHRPHTHRPHSLITNNSDATYKNAALSVENHTQSSHHDHSHARSSSYLPGLAGAKLPFRTNSLDAMHKGRPRGESDLGRPARPALQTRNLSSSYALHTTSTAEEDSSITTPRSSKLLTFETLTAILLPLPFLLSSLNNPLNISAHHIHHSKSQVAGEVLEEVASSAVPLPDSLLGLVQACALTAGTLLLVGIWGRIQRKTPSARKRKSSVSSGREHPGGKGSMGQTIRRLLLRIACVALPYLATVEIGGVRTGMILLVAATGGLIGHNSKASQGTKIARIRQAVSSHRWTCSLFITSLLYDLYWHTAGTEYSSTIRGYIALAKSALLLFPPLPTSTPASSTLTSIRSRSSSQASATSATSNSPRDYSAPASRFKRPTTVSALIATPADTNFTLAAGLLCAALTILLGTLSTAVTFLNLTIFVLYIASITSAASLYILARPSTLRTEHKTGLGIGLSFCAVFGFYFEYTTRPAAFALTALSIFAFAAVQLDTRSTHDVKKDHSHHHHAHHHHDQAHAHAHAHAHTGGSRVTQWLLTRTEHSPLLHSILLDKESRRIVYFMFINLGFMFVQTFYALVSGSLGLLSDSIHMFFDCMGLLAGLVASVMSKWPPNAKFPYGYGKVETLSGLGNGIFLMIISVEIIFESFERFTEGAELKRLNELLLVSVGGLAVNLIGLKFIGHAHHHGHDHGHDHGHSHGAHDHSHANGHAPEHKHDHHDNLLKQVATSDSHDHAHGHANENMMGIYLHILADTMGSVAVIVSTLLTAYTGWSGWDPIASFVIAVLIIAASIPLVVGSARRLLLTVPDEIEYALRTTLQEISNLRGVVGYAVPRFWLEDGEAADSHGHSHDHQEHAHKARVHGHDLDENHDHKHQGHNQSHSHGHDHGHDHQHKHDSDHKHGHDHKHEHGHDKCTDENPFRGQKKILGVIHVIAARGADVEDVRQRTDEFLKERNMHVIIQVDRQGQGRCWCGGDKGGHHRTSSVVPGL